MKDGKLFLSSILMHTHSNLLLDKSLLLHKQEVLRCSPKKKGGSEQVFSLQNQCETSASALWILCATTCLLCKWRSDSAL